MENLKRGRKRTILNVAISLIMTAVIIVVLYLLTSAIFGFKIAVGYEIIVFCAVLILAVVFACLLNKSDRRDHAH